MTGKEDQAVKLEVFDPPMCCSSGVCGPNVDKRNIKVPDQDEFRTSYSPVSKEYRPGPGSKKRSGRGSGIGSLSGEI